MAASRSPTGARLARLGTHLKTTRRMPHSFRWRKRKEGTWRHPCGRAQSGLHEPSGWRPTKPPFDERTVARPEASDGLRIITPVSRSSRYIDGVVISELSGMRQHAGRLGRKAQCGGGVDRESGVLRAA